MPVIWELDLKEMQWGRLKDSYMFNRVYHLRRTKVIVYQCAMILLVVSESAGTAALSDYVDQQDGITTRSAREASIQNNDIVGVLSYNVFVGIAVATIFGSGFFFDLFWAERKEGKSVKLAWKICLVFMSIMTLADAIAVTIIVASHNAYITGVSPEYARTLYIQNGPPNLNYSKNAECVASVVLLWLGTIATFASTYIMWKSLIRNDQYEPSSAAYRNKGEETCESKIPTPHMDATEMTAQPNHSTAQRTSVLADEALVNEVYNGT